MVLEIRLIWNIVNCSKIILCVVFAILDGQRAKIALWLLFITKAQVFYFEIYIFLVRFLDLGQEVVLRLL